MNYLLNILKEEILSTSNDTEQNIKDDMFEICIPIEAKGKYQSILEILVNLEANNKVSIGFSVGIEHEGVTGSYTLEEISHEFIHPNLITEIYQINLAQTLEALDLIKNLVLKLKEAVKINNSSIMFLDFRGVITSPDGQPKDLEHSFM